MKTHKTKKADTKLNKIKWKVSVDYSYLLPNYYPKKSPASSASFFASLFSNTCNVSREVFQVHAYLGTGEQLVMLDH